MQAPTPDEHVLQLATYWPYQITVLADRIARRTTRVVKGFGLNLSQWRVLAAIAEVPGRTSAEVVSITPMDKGIVSRATKALLEQGLVVRRASQSDGRVSHLHLTEAGRDRVRELTPRVSEVVHEATAVLPAADQARLTELLTALMQSVPDGRA